MQLIKDTRNGNLYKTPLGIENDRLCMLNTFRFIKANVLTDKDRWSRMKCLDKFPYIKIVGEIDGRTKAAKKLHYFTWAICCEDIKELVNNKK